MIWRSNSVTLNKFPQSSHLAVVKGTKSPLSRFNIFQITNKLAMVSGTLKKKTELQSIPPLHHSKNLTTKFATQILCWMMQWKAGTFFQSWMHPWNLLFHVLQVCHLWKWSQLFHFSPNCSKLLPERGLHKIVYMCMLTGKIFYWLKNFAGPSNDINYNFFTTLKDARYTKKIF